jgi:hypothetical protein
MSDVKVNKVIWDALSESDKKYITTHLKEYGVLKAEQNIVADAYTPPPTITPHINDIPGASESAEALGIDWTCRAICDATKAEINCVLYGQPLSACLHTIAASRENCHFDNSES